MDVIGMGVRGEGFGGRFCCMMVAALGEGGLTSSFAAKARAAFEKAPSAAREMAL